MKNNMNMNINTNMIKNRNNNMSMMLNLKSYIKFDWETYINNYEDLERAGINTKEKAWNHWITNGKRENRIYNTKIPKAVLAVSDPDNSQFIYIKTAKIGIIYVYYERVNEQKNQTNLSFFIKYGLDEKLWSNLNISTLFVINGHQCEVLIPSKPNVYVLKEDNCSDWEGWYNGIKYFENSKGKKIWEIFDYLCLINAGAIGPIYESNIHDHWLIPFYNKMVKDNAVVCSPCMSFLPNTNPSGPGPKVVPIFSLIKCTETIINILTNVNISCTDELSTDKFYKKRSLHLFNTDTNTVLGAKHDKQDAVLTGEYGLSRILINAGYRLTSLLYNDSIDCHNPDFWNINGLTEPDRYMSFNGKNIPLSTIFIKNIWRVGNGYVCLPVLYNECMDFVYSKLNMKSIFNNKPDIVYNYNLLNICEKGIQKSSSWNTKQEYYNLYGFAEEVILFNKPMKETNGYLIYAHYDADNIVKDYVIQTVKTFIYLGYNILFYTASTKIQNVNSLPFKVNFVNNMGPGTDWKIWASGCITLLKENITTPYVFLLNDSIILPINGIDNFENTINEMRKNSDFWGHWESREVERHIVGTPIEFKYALIKDVINFINDRVKPGMDKMDYVFKIEVKFAQYLVNRGYKCNVVIKCNTYNNTVCCPVFNPVNINKWINNPNSFAIKWKYMISYLNQNTLNPELNYLTRFLYYGKYGFISDGEKIGAFPKSSP